MGHDTCCMVIKPQHTDGVGLAIGFLELLLMF